MNGLHEVKRLLKYSVIRAGLDMIAALQLHKFIPSAAKNGLIFTLHHVCPADPELKFSPNAILSVTPEFLEATIKQVLQAGMIPVHVHDLPDLLRNNPEQRRYVCFTLDDGYRDNADYAAPIFRRYNIPYTIYITSGFTEHSHILWWEVTERLLRHVDRFSFDFGAGLETLSTKTRGQKMSAFDRFAHFIDENEEDNAVERIAALAVENGIDPLQLTQELIMDVSELRALMQKDEFVHFGAHTISHINLRRVDEARMYREIEASAQWLYHNLDMMPASFSYPYGWKTAVSQNTLTAARKAGFAIAVTTQPGMLEPACLEQPQAFPRVSLNGYFQKTRYVKALTSGIAFIAGNIINIYYT